MVKIWQNKPKFQNCDRTHTVVRCNVFIGRCTLDITSTTVTTTTSSRSLQGRMSQRFAGFDLLKPLPAIDSTAHIDLRVTSTLDMKVECMKGIPYKCTPAYSSLAKVRRGLVKNTRARSSFVCVWLSVVKHSTLFFIYLWCFVFRQILNTLLSHGFWFLAPIFQILNAVYDWKPILLI